MLAWVIAQEVIKPPCLSYCLCLTVCVCVCVKTSLFVVLSLIITLLAWVIAQEVIRLHVCRIVSVSLFVCVCVCQNLPVCRIVSNYYFVGVGYSTGSNKTPCLSHCLCLTVCVCVSKPPCLSYCLCSLFVCVSKSLCLYRFSLSVSQTRHIVSSKSFPPSLSSAYISKSSRF